MTERLLPSSQDSKSAAMAKDDACIAEVIAGLANVETIVGGLEALRRQGYLKRPRERPWRGKGYVVASEGDLSAKHQELSLEEGHRERGGK